MTLARALVQALELYFGLGLLFALALTQASPRHGLERVDPAAHGAPRGFRLLLVPGCAALWPWLLVRWLRARRAA